MEFFKVFSVAGFAGLLALMTSTAAHAVCLPEANDSSRLLIADVSDCGSPIGESFCASELSNTIALPERVCRDGGSMTATMSVYAAQDSILPKKSGSRAQTQSSPFEAVLLGKARTTSHATTSQLGPAIHTGSILGSAIAGLDPASVAVLAAGLILAAGQMRRRASLRVVCS